MKNLKVKLILLGNTSVGKTSLFFRYTTEKFPENYKSTIGIDSQKKGIEYKGYKVDIHIFDSAGQERYKSVTKMYLRNVNGFFLVFDLTNKESLKDLSYWIEEIKSLDDINNNMIIIGNKKDLNDLRAVTDEDIAQFEKDIGHQVIQTSAKTGEGIKEAFDAMIEQIFRNKNEEELYMEFIPNYKYNKLTKKKTNQNSNAHCC